ncbi:hypothetical protein RJ40_03945 [Methanofollis aquaemaris]|uniref:Uncharacterized protein n=1 Tax=Methanofollis aquaemaris TaxID=126734 RepID=A0A8A3S510_9EURY|nr:glycosyltransferase family 39 protein [Methanofollis aquaemaris]QSZ66704.1 hypothetical protein RJ40_03945 [Methanofollis aquaemaris]
MTERTPAPMRRDQADEPSHPSAIQSNLMIVLLSFLIALTISYPAIFITDEWISADQVNHLVEGEDLLYGYHPYGSSAYAASHHDCLCYTLALPTLSLPAYYLFSLFDDSFRLFVLILWSALLLAVILMIEWWFPKYARWRGVPWTYAAIISWTYAAIISWGILFVLNMALYRPFWFVRGVHPGDVSVYPEVAAIVFTNTVALALFALLVYHLFREVFGPVRWGIFGLVATLTSSFYLFWSGNAKDHMLVMLFFTLAVYLFTLYLSRDRPLWLFASFIAVGWTAWARPELGPSLLAGFLLFALLLVLAARKGWRECGTIVLTVSGVALGALPLFVNNLALTGHPLLLPWQAGCSGAAVPRGLSSAAGTLQATVTRQYALPSGDLISGCYGTFFDPSFPGSAGIFQVSSFSFFALLLVVPLARRLRTSGRLSLTATARDARFITFFALTALIVLAAYLRSVSGMSGSPGIVPDMRYLSPIYLPMIVLGTYALRYIGFGENEITRSLQTLFWLIVIDLPLIYVVLQIHSGTQMSGELVFLMPLTYLFLAAAAALYLLTAAGRVRPMALATLLPVLMLFSLAWWLVADFRFATLCWEGYHFWIPVVQYIWYMQYAVFPL